MNALPNIVLVHGAWAEGSCWSAVIEHLQADGYTVTAPEFPETSLADDVARLRQVLDRQHGPIEVPASHVAMVSHPDEVVQLIETAAQALRIVDAG